MKEKTEMVLSDLEEIKNLLSNYMSESYRYWKFNEIITLLNKLPLEKRSKFVNSPIIQNENISFKEKTKTSILTVACLRNDVNACDYLIKECGAHTETLVTMNEYELWDNITFYSAPSPIDNNKYSAVFNVKAPILWHSCRGNSISIIKVLVENGADINSKAESFFNSTPLMVACAKNRLDVVQYLVEKGANIHEKNIYDETCLFYAVRHNEKAEKLVSYLISLGLDINVKNKQKKTVLDYSVELQTSKMMVYLMKTNKIGFDSESIENSLITLAVNGNASKFYDIFDYGNISKETRLDALETIGASLFLFSDEIESVFTFWELSLDSRFKCDEKKQHRHISREILPEFTNSSELKMIENDFFLLVMQSLTIIDRILNKYQRFYTPLCRFIFYDRYHDHIGPFKSLPLNNFKKFQTMWYYTISLQMSYLKPGDSYIFENIYDFMQYLISIPTIEIKEYKKEYSIALLDIFKSCLHEFKRIGDLKFNNKSNDFYINESLKNVNKMLENIDYSNIFQYKSSNKKVNYHLLDKFEIEHLTKYFGLFIELSVYILSYIIYNHGSRCLFTQDQLDEIKLLTKKLIYFTSNLKDYKLRVLAIATRSNTVSNFNMYMKNKFNIQDDTTLNYNFVKYLLDCGADPDTIIYGTSNKPSRNTFLNYGLFNDKYFDDRSVCESFIKLFLKYGAHLDYLNDSNNSLANNYLDKFDRLLTFIINSSDYISLKCLASKSISRSKINYLNQLPKDLAEFVKRH